MIPLWKIDLGTPSLLEFHGSDTVRYLNGQLTQDVRLLIGKAKALPSCLTDAKGKLQFRVWAREGSKGSIFIDAGASAEALEARLTRYLIADDVEVVDRSGQWSLIHFTGLVNDAPECVIVCASNRYGIPGTDWWIPAGQVVDFPSAIPELTGDALETFRIEHGVPAWGKELYEGLLPPEAKLDATDVSYHKGCYIGQEVISRIKSAGKVNKLLTSLMLDASIPSDGLAIVDAEGNTAGEITSIAPLMSGEVRYALAYLKRGISDVFWQLPDGTRIPAGWVAQG